MLPDEMIEEIGKYLDIDSVLACSLLNKAWRNGLNRNPIWKRLCYHHFLIPPIGNEGPILRESSSVPPPFSVPENRSEDLEEVCAWRIRFAQQIRIQNNFSFGSYSIETPSERMVEEVDLWMSEATTNVHLNYRHNEDYLVLHMEKRNYFSMWRHWPSMHEMPPINFALSDVPITTFELNYGIYFVYVQESLLVVYHRTNGDHYTLKNRYILHKEPEFAGNIPDEEDITVWYHNHVESSEMEPTSMFSQDKFFIVEYRMESETHLHIWDLQNGTKKAYKINIRLSCFAHFKCIVPPDPTSLFFFFTDNDKLCNEKLYRLNLYENSIGTLLKVTNCFCPIFFAQKFAYIKRGANNVLKTIDLHNKQMKQTKVKGNKMVRLSAMHASIFNGIGPLELDAAIYDMKKLKQENIKELSVVRNGIFISRNFYANICHGKSFDVSLHVHNLKLDTTAFYPLCDIPSTSLLFRIGQAKFLVSASKAIFNFW